MFMMWDEIALPALYSAILGYRLEQYIFIIACLLQ